MKASVAGRVRNTQLPRTKPLLPAFEAIINSLQAIEETGEQTGHVIRIHCARQGSLDDAKHAPFDMFTISDTGAGFTDDNYDSFNIVDSPYKAEHGGKGLGRFVWLKAFERVEIDSHYRTGDNADLTHRRFAFVATDEDQPCELKASDLGKPLTTVRLIGLRPPYLDECPRGLDALAHRVVEHFLPLFLDPHLPEITLSDDSDELDLKKYFAEHFESQATKHEFKVGGQRFTLNGFRLHSTAADHHEIVFGAHYREVTTDRLSRYLPNLKAKFVDADHRSFTYLAFVQGDYLNQKVNSERTDFSIPRDAPAADANAPAGDKSTDLFAGELSLKTIRDAALESITADLKPYIEEINSAKEAALSHYIHEDAPQYRPLMKYKDEFIDQIPPGASKSEMETALHRQLYQRQVRLKDEGRRILEEATNVQNPEDFYERFDRFVSDENELGKTALAQYVVHRRVILDLLDKALKLDPETGKHGLEKTVHSLVFPMKTTSDDVPFEQQNLWIIDERLTFHTYLSSDTPLEKVSVLDNDSSSRPDILIFDRPLSFAEDSQPLSSVIVIEFKKPDLTRLRDEDPISQAYRMIREIREGKMKDKDGRYIRPANESIPAYCYVICDLTPPIETRIQNMGARRTPDNLGYYGFNETLNAYYEVISYTKLAADAKKRNRVLFEKLSLQ